MSAELDMTATFNGGFFSGLAKKFLGGESLFVNRFTNATKKPLRVTLVQSTPGDVREVSLDGGSVCLQPGAFLAATPDVKLGLRWAGFASLIAREGLFKLEASGRGRLWYGAYGALLDRTVAGEYVVDTGHLVAYDPQLKLKLQLAGGLFGSLLGGEGIVTRIEGRGKIVLQTRSLSGLAGWLNPRI
jgi:uncharacterized protein (TIGR00266 family)